MVTSTMRLVLMLLFVVGVGGLSVQGLAQDKGESSETVSAPVLIVNPEVDVEDIDLDDLRDLYLGNTTFWESGARVQVIIVGTPSPEKEAVLDELVEMSERRFKQYWIGRVFQNRASSAPRAVADSATAVALVRAVPGAVAIVSPGASLAGVQAVTIDGHGASEPDYPLR